MLNSHYHDHHRHHRHLHCQRHHDDNLCYHHHYSQGQILTFLLPGRSLARRQPNLDEFSAAIWSRRRFPAHRSNDGFIPSLLLHQNLHQNKLASTVNTFCVCQSLLQSKNKDSHTALYAWVGPIYIMGMRANLVQKISFKMPGKVYIVNLLTAIYLLWKFWWSAVSKLALPWKFETTFCWCLIKICVTKSNLHKNGLCSQEQLLKTILL